MTNLTGSRILAWAADVGGDGSDDLLMATAHKNYQLVLTTALSEHDGTFRMIKTITETSWPTPRSIFDPLHCQPGDANGDGRFDVICSYSYSPDEGARKVPQFVATALSKGDGTFTPVSKPAPDFQLPPATTNPWGYDTSEPVPPPDFGVGDIDGDGNADALLAYGNTWLSGTSRGDGHYDFVERVKYAFHGYSMGKLRAADINGDGRQDFLRISDFGPHNSTRRGAVQTLTSQPDGSWIPRDRIAVSPAEIVG